MADEEFLLTASTLGFGFCVILEAADVPLPVLLLQASADTVDQPRLSST